MKRLTVLTISFALMCITSYAQIRVVDIQRDADTLMFEFSSGIELNRIYKNQYGYFMREESDNMFDPYQKFYIGQDKEECIKSAERFKELFNEDVQTKARVIDAMGKEFYVVTDYGIGGTRRKKIKQKSNFVRLTSEDMSGSIYIRKKSIEELIEVLSKQP